MALTTVFFDLGETLVDETRYWQEWAGYLDVPSAEFLAVLHRVIAEGRPHREAFEAFQPGFDLTAAKRARIAAGTAYRLTAADFYDDALPCLRALRAAGYKTGIAGNQPREIEAELRDLVGSEVDFIATSEGLGAEKPEGAFFQRICALAEVPASSVVYVGDRMDNDVRPATAAGLLGIFLRRGPWAAAQDGAFDAAAEGIKIQGLMDLMARLPTRKPI